LGLVSQVKGLARAKMQVDKGDFIAAVSLLAEAIKYDPEAATAPEAQCWCGVASSMRVGLI
jgi:hypothetical protein